MAKVSRTFRIDPKLSTALDIIHTRSGDYTYHLEAALSQYGPIKAVLGNSAPKAKAKPVAVIDEAEFDRVWAMYGKKGNRKTSRLRFGSVTDEQKVVMYNHLPAYVESTPEKKYRKNFEAYINQECWNDEVINNAENRSNGNSGPNRQSTVDRVRATNAANRASRADNRNNLGDADGHLREHSGESIRGCDAGSLDSVIEGTFTHSDEGGTEQAGDS